MTTGYAQDILPMFRTGDISCMMPKGVSIDNAQWMCDPAAANHGFDDYGMHGGFLQRFRAASCRPMASGRNSGWIYIRAG